MDDVTKVIDDNVLVSTSLKQWSNKVRKNSFPHSQSSYPLGCCH